MLRPCTKKTQSKRTVKLPKASFDSSFDSSSWRSRKRFFILQLLVACCVFKTDAVDVERKTIVRKESNLTTKDKASLHQEDVNTTVVNKTFVKSVVLTRPAAKEESSLQVNATKAAKVAQVPPEAAGVGIALQPQPTVGASVPVLASGVQTTASPLLTAVQPQEVARPAETAAAHASHEAKVAATHRKHAELVKKKKKEDDDRERAYHGKVIVISVGATLAVLCMCRMCCAGNKKQNNSATARRASFNAAATAFAARRPSGSGDPRRSAQFDAQTLNRSVKKNLRGSVAGEQGEASDGKSGSGKAESSDNQGGRRSSYRERRSKSTERRNSRSAERSGGDLTSESASPGERRSDARRASNGKEATAADAPSLRVIPPADNGAAVPRPSTGSAGSYRSRREASRPRSPSAEPPKDAELEF